MVYEVIELNKCFNGLQKADKSATLHMYLQDNSPEIEIDRKRPAMIICPGGGYWLTSDREAEPMALRFLAHGYQVFVLRYNVAPSRYPQQLLELSAAVAYVRTHAATLHVDDDNVTVCGFSAGGHLVGSLGVLWQEAFILEALGINYGDNRPDRLILSYPVITGGPFANKGSFDNLLGAEASEEERSALSLEHLVNPLTPPTFIWHTYEDEAVPVENSLLFAQALRRNQVPFELHIYTKGVHGLSLGDLSTCSPSQPQLINEHAATWFELVLGWLKNM